jgi:hypothetical protein
LGRRTAKKTFRECNCEGGQRNRSLVSVMGKDEQRDRRFGCKLGRGTKKQKFRSLGSVIGKGNRETGA